MPRILGDGYSDCFFPASRADKHSGELLLDDTDYSASSSPQWLELYTLEGQDSIFTFGSMTPRFLSLHSWARPEISKPARFLSLIGEENDGSAQTSTPRDPQAYPRSELHRWLCSWS